MLKHLCTAFGLFLATSLFSPVVAEENSDWFRHSAISPDGSTIVFSYKGDIYSVSAKGGRATALTIHSAWEGHPVWSRDGKQIAFASDRHGNLDVYVMPADGGKAVRLTRHSANDVPSDFSSAVTPYCSNLLAPTLPMPVCFRRCVWPSYTKSKPMVVHLAC